MVQVTVHGVSPEGERESVMGKVCKTDSFKAGNERLRELWVMRVVNQQRVCVSRVFFTNFVIVRITLYYEDTCCC